MTDKKVAVVFGASGIIGGNLAERLASSGSWEVVSVTRHAHKDLPGSRAIACVLSVAKLVQQALSAAKDATHVFLLRVEQASQRA